LAYIKIIYMRENYTLFSFGDLTDWKGLLLDFR
jgi:hypothetical protein